MIDNVMETELFNYIVRIRKTLQTTEIIHIFLWALYKMDGMKEDLNIVQY